MENSWTKFFLTSILFVVIAIPVIYMLGFNAKEQGLIKNVVQNKIINRFIKN